MKKIRNIPFFMYVILPALMFTACQISGESPVSAIGWIGGGSNGWHTGSAPSYGTDYKSFTSPYCVHVDSAGNIYVADRDNNRISKWK